MKKKLLSMLLSFTLAAGMFVGCGAGAETASGGEKTETEASSNMSAAERAIEERKNSGEIPTLVVAFMNWTGAPSGQERISKRLSEYTEEKLGVHVELMVIDAASYTQSITLMLSSGEQLDVFNINGGAGAYSSNVNKGYLYDLEEESLLELYGAGIRTAVNEDYIEACRINGVLYGLPQNRDMASGLGAFAVGAQYLEGIGFDYASMLKEGDEIIYTDLDTMNKIFAQLHEAYPEKDVLAVSGARNYQLIDYDSLGDNFGVLLDPENSLEVVNLYETDEYRKSCEIVYEWNQLGYISPDALTSDLSVTAQVQAGTAMAYQTGGKPGIRAQETGSCGMDMVIFQTGKDYMASSAVTGMPWGISYNCEDPIAAMQFLNLCYTDSYVSNLLCWGEEGVEYQITEDGHFTFADGVNADNSEYFNNVNWEMPNQFIAGIWEGDSLNIWENMADFNDGAAKSKALGFVFDNSQVTTAYTALSNALSQYDKLLGYGFVDPAEGIPQLQEALSAAGLETYMEAKQEALDAWAEANNIK